MVASAEEESSGKNGLNSVLKHLPKLDCAIVGEPTLMQLAIAEKGLLVLDVIVKGTPSHAAHQHLFQQQLFIRVRNAQQLTLGYKHFL